MGRWLGRSMHYWTVGLGTSAFFAEAGPAVKFPTSFNFLCITLGKGKDKLSHDKSWMVPDMCLTLARMQGQFYELDYFCGILLPQHGVRSVHDQGYGLDMYSLHILVHVDTM